MVLTSPLMLLGLLALPVLAAVYWLRSRSRRAVVSSLAFWTDQRSPRRGGRILHRMQTPLSFFLELLAIAMLVMAAAGPALLKRDVVRPLVVVLDDSYSMLACTSADGTDSAAPAGRDGLGRRTGGATTTWPDSSWPAHSPGWWATRCASRLAPTRFFAQWTCESPSADLAAAMALAAEVGGPAARILVLSDHAPTTTLGSGQTRVVGLRRQAAQHGLHRGHPHPIRRKSNGCCWK